MGATGFDQDRRGPGVVASMILDAGVFILAERNPARCAALLERLIDEPFRTNEAVMGQVWRNPPRQVLVTRFLAGNDVDVEPLTDGKAIGVLLSKAQTSDVVDGSVALMAITGDDIVLTSDPEDLGVLGATTVSIRD